MYNEGKFMRIKEKYLILISTSIFMFAIAGSRPLISLYSTELGANIAEVGLITSLFSLLSLFLAIPLGRSIDKVNVKTPLYLCLGLCSISLIIPFVLGNIIGICISQILAGVAQMTFVISIQSYAGGMKDRKTQEYYIAIFSIGVAIGSFVGPLVSGLLSQSLDYATVMFYLGMTVIFAFPFIYYLLGYSRTIKDEIKDNKIKDTFDLLNNHALRKAILISALLLLGKDIYISFFPLLAQSKGISNAMIGLIISVNAAAGIFIRMVTPLLLQQFKSSIIITTALVIGGCSYILNPLADNFFILLFVSFILGLCLGVGQPLSISNTIRALPAARIGEGLGLRLSINKLTQVVAPVVLGGVSNLYGIFSVFYITGFIIFFGSIDFKAATKLTLRVKKK
ncbi:MFS transporter [Paenisporosarcina antarctica]|uniref:MFS transporter n=1 Tax=Paenisporosarcina antarctica TaxID=417367 RepID=A0A4P7A122_9BACL|nr:MFS transporter [Paenisporosarcina antarctica]QBP42710.1 MFS transporter [Paenisporosarcina antarctica]